MKFVHYGNACFSLFHKDLHLLFDPWIEAPAVAGGWSVFPPSHTKTSDLAKIDYIFISHIHSDHCEPETLKKIDKNIPIIILEREPNFLKKYLVHQGFKNLILVPSKTKKKISDAFSVELFGESFGHLCNNIIDSSILFEFSDGKIVLNCNDNKPSTELCSYIKSKYPNIELAMVPGGGGSGYPAMYENYSFEEKMTISQDIIDRYAKVFTEAVDVLNPRVVVPVAGGFAIRGPLAETVNWVQCRRLNMLELVEHYNKLSKNKSSIVRPMQPGMELDVDKAAYIKGEYHVWTDSELKAHFKKLSLEKPQALVSTQTTIPNFGKLIQSARNALWLRQEKNGMKPDYRIYFDILGASKIYEIDLSKNYFNEFAKLSDNSADTQKMPEMKPPYLRMRLDQDTMLEWLLGLEDYNMLDSGHRISFWREPVANYVQEAYFLMSLLRLT